MKAPLSSDPLAILLEHNRWATGQLLDLCGRLTPAQFHQRFPIGLGSLHDNLTHIIGAMRRWADRISGAPLRPSIERLPAHKSNIPSEPRDRTPAELRQLLEEAHLQLKNVAETYRSDLAQTIDITFGQKTYTFTRGVALTHALVHGTHHRAQCLNMLRSLSVPGLSDQLPDIDVVDWQYETECKP